MLYSTCPRRNRLSTMAATLRCLRRALARILVLAALLAGPASAVKADGKITPQARMNLQLALMDYISERAPTGAFTYLDPVRKQLVALRFTHLHPVILPFDDYYVLCADFRAEDGTHVELDFLLSADGPDHRVIQTLIDQRPLVMATVKPSG